MRRSPVFIPSGAEPRLSPLPGIKAVIFDVYGTLLLGGGPVYADAEADIELTAFLADQGIRFDGSVTEALADAVKRSHAASTAAFPEVDLKALWSEVLRQAIDKPLFIALEDIRQPVALMPGVRETLTALSHLPLGLISNAQANTIPTLERLTGLTDAFAPDLCILSYQYGEAKPAPALFDSLATALAIRGIQPAEALVVGNDPLHDISPATSHGFHTALVMADHHSLRPGDPEMANAVVTDVRQIADLLADGY
ncbi:HAD family hydrolase [Luteolibacter ambystomatis]|uniref:HAD family hydrolase n=1 Tax=Luteolibacter ambystomatis TaxID=2824561 RepID=A0A975PGM2_9BACT|nr:HAD family hydrolase [Luteolibacter ambystomatis]QUE52868.1 HAD family hydrolase [Luteolibacter ambystomatis]